MRRGTVESGGEARMLRDEVRNPRPRRQRVERLDEACAEQRPCSVALPTRPSERVKIAHECGHFGGDEDGGDFGSDRAPWYLLTCQAS
jgi:hypothetical protein